MQNIIIILLSNKDREIHERLEILKDNNRRSRTIPPPLTPPSPPPTFPNLLFFSDSPTISDMSVREDNDDYDDDDDDNNNDKKMIFLPIQTNIRTSTDFGDVVAIKPQKIVFSDDLNRLFPKADEIFSEAKPKTNEILIPNYETMLSEIDKGDI